MENVFLSLGSNLGDRKKHLSFAVDAISKSGNRILQVSAVYETEPWGFQAEQNFLNQVIKISTENSANVLLKSLKTIEQLAGRTRSSEEGYESRALDIDILFYGNQLIDNDDLIIPHPRLHLRKFVLIPLADIAADFIHPRMEKKIITLLETCPDKTFVRLFDEKKN